jgi:RNA polymerase sigma-70 factor, ECF subfamily
MLLLVLAMSAVLTYPRRHSMDQRSSEARVTELLIAASDGRREALDELVPLLYDDLRRLAAAHMRREPAGHSLQPTALVHETYVRLVDQRQARWLSRANFFGAAAGVMRRILVDLARTRRADKRGGRLARVTLAEDVAADSPREIDVLALHESLERMAAFSPRQERIVELRYFGGLTIEETAAVLGISDATVVREWTIAKAWLRAALSSR